MHKLDRISNDPKFEIRRLLPNYRAVTNCEKGKNDLLDRKADVAAIFAADNLPTCSYLGLSLITYRKKALFLAF